MCLQANISAALLSNVDEFNNGERGDQMVREMTEHKVTYNDTMRTAFSYDKTVCGYLMAQIDKRGIDFKDVLYSPSLVNKYIPTNMDLLCGDHYVEIIAKRLEGERSLPPARRGPWRSVTQFLKVFVDGVVAAGNRKTIYTFFIDTNPSFSVYTELAVLSANRLIVPINADDFSRAAVKSMLYLLYGIEIDNKRQIKYEHLKEYEFWYRAKEEGLILLQIHLVINNKITSYKGVAKAFKAKESEIVSHIQTVKLKEPTRFVDHPQILCELNDLHTVAVQCLHCHTIF
ncbi:unnamed protein product [Mytilus coruscus]|uniref:Uncharacterized protein n=1 Tax=Mytilus coruscus TaxID=42192 RepID=A0A6J8DUA0_MYTCO|nr:unnamed protein product [Mytilus coruscus]